MKITNNHKGPLGLPDGQVLQPSEATHVPGWDKIKGNAVVQGWIAARILSVEKASAPAAAKAPATILNLPATIELVNGVTVQRSDVVRKAQAVAGLSIDAWNELDETLLEDMLSQAVEILRKESIAEAEANAAAAASGEQANGGGASGGDAGDGDIEDKGVLVAKAKALSIPGVGSHWGVGKLKEAIAEAEAKKGEG